MPEAALREVVVFDFAHALRPHGFPLSAALAESARSTRHTHFERISVYPERSEGSPVQQLRREPQPQLLDRRSFASLRIKLGISGATAAQRTAAPAARPEILRFAQDKVREASFLLVFSVYPERSEGSAVHQLRREPQPQLLDRRSFASLRIKLGISGATAAQRTAAPAARPEILRFAQDKVREASFLLEHLSKI